MNKTIIKVFILSLFILNLTHSSEFNQISSMNCNAAKHEIGQSLELNLDYQSEIPFIANINFYNGALVDSYIPISSIELNNHSPLYGLTSFVIPVHTVKNSTELLLYISFNTARNGTLRNRENATFISANKWGDEVLRVDIECDLSFYR